MADLLGKPVHGRLSLNRNLLQTSDRSAKFDAIRCSTKESSYQISGLREWTVYTGSASRRPMFQHSAVPRQLELCEQLLSVPQRCHRALWKVQQSGMWTESGQCRWGLFELCDIFKPLILSNCSFNTLAGVPQWENINNPWEKNQYHDSKTKKIKNEVQLVVSLVVVIIH